VPTGTSIADWPAIERLGAALLERTCESPTELERWLEDASELAACVDEEWARRDIAFTAKTDDPVLEQSRLTWIREIRPRWQKLCHQFDAVYLASPHRYALPRRYRVFDQLTDNGHALYREDNLSLLVTAGELTQAYEKRRAAMTIMYEGREYTSQQAVLFLESPDRALR
jgi:oligoendopeptidase F